MERQGADEGNVARDSIVETGCRCDGRHFPSRVLLNIGLQPPQLRIEHPQADELNEQARVPRGPRAKKKKNEIMKCPKTGSGSAPAFK